MRGIISPPRSSQSSPRDNRPYYTPTNTNAATTIDPRRRRPAAAAANKPNELQQSPRIETSTTTTTTHSTAMRPTKAKTNIDPSKPTTKSKKSDSNSATKSAATKITSRPSSSSPRATAARPGSTPKGSGVASQRSRNEPPKQITSLGLGQQQDVKIADVHSQLQQLSFDGKDLASIVLPANSIYESLGSDTKEECSSQTNTNARRIFQIYKEITSHRQETNSSITSYFTKLKSLWDELATHTDLPQCSCGAIEKLNDHTEREKTMQFLAGLNDSYSTICTQILLLRPFPTLERAHKVIIREEQRREFVSSLEMVAATVM